MCFLSDWAGHVGSSGGGVPSCGPAHSVLGHGLGSQAAKLKHGTVAFSCSFLFRPADAPLSLEPWGRPR